jgi:hypothetical protein
MLFPSSLAPSQYVDGMAFHWYGGTGDRLLDGTYGYDAVNATYHMAPDKILMATEGCSCPGGGITFTLHLFINCTFVILYIRILHSALS